jgi:hypothetical protein
VALAPKKALPTGVHGDAAAPAAAAGTLENVQGEHAFQHSRPREARGTERRRRASHSDRQFAGSPGFSALIDCGDGARDNL